MASLAHVFLLTYLAGAFVGNFSNYFLEGSTVTRAEFMKDIDRLSYV